MGALLGKPDGGVLSWVHKLGLHFITIHRAFISFFMPDLAGTISGVNSWVEAVLR